MKALLLVNHEFNGVCSEKSSQLKRMYELFKKYNCYQLEDANPSVSPMTAFLIALKGNPLLDALSTGLDRPFFGSTFDVYGPKIEGDIIAILKLTPRSTNRIFSKLRGHSLVFPLAAAGFNINIPVHLIEKLLQNGANVNANIIYSYSKLTPLLDVWHKANIRVWDEPEEVNSKDKDRANQIIALFYKYGYRGNVKKY